VQIFYINHENAACGDLKACWSTYSGHFTLHCVLYYICFTYPSSWNFSLYPTILLERKDTNTKKGHFNSK